MLIAVISHDISVNLRVSVINSAGCNAGHPAYIGNGNIDKLSKMPCLHPSSVDGSVHLFRFGINIYLYADEGNAFHVPRCS